MAANQADPHENDVNLDIAPQEQTLLTGNNSLQNGTDKAGVSGADVGLKNISVDMSQYRQESGPNIPDQNVHPSDDTVKINNCDKSFSLGSEQSVADMSYDKCSPEAGSNLQTYGHSFSQRPNFVHPESTNHMLMAGESLHQQSNAYGSFGPGARNLYGTASGKPLSRSPSGSTSFSQQRFQGISSPPAGTPTLNQLLQSNSAQNKYSNSYSEFGVPKSTDQLSTAASYNQNWPPTRPVPPYSPQAHSFRNQPPSSSQGSSNQSNSSHTGQAQQTGASMNQAGSQQSSGNGNQQVAGPISGSNPSSRSYSGYPPSPSQSLYHPPSPYRHTYQVGVGGYERIGGNGGYDRGSWSPGPSAPLDHPPSPQQQIPSQHQVAYLSKESPSAPPPDTADLSGQNSNDSSCGGGGRGTPNSGSVPLRPSPSPTGSSGSRSMSPAIAPCGQMQQPPQLPPPLPSQCQQPTHPSILIPQPPSALSESVSGPSRHSNAPVTQSSHLPMTQLGNVSTPGASSVSHQTPTSQPPTGYQGSGPNPQHLKIATNTSIGPNLISHITSNNLTQSQQVPPYSSQHSPHQYTPQSNYRGNLMGNYMGQSYINQGGPQQSQFPSHRPSSTPNNSQNSQFPAYQQKVSGYPPVPGTYGNHSMGPPALHPGMPPPPPPHHDGPMPPPASTSSDLHDAPTSTSQTGTSVISNNNSNSCVTSGATSIVTTGPDGATLDEASQQSTLSNASAASGEDSTTMTPSKRGSKENIAYQSGHPTTPQSTVTVPSPGTASINSVHEEFPPDHSPTWSRTPNSPVYNSHLSQELFRPKKHDSLGKLYEMDETVERKAWLDKLLQYMEERGTPISACPTISKNPLDLFRLYILVKERGGFMEVTKNKIWKDIAGILGIGASSSAAYTLRKHYTKNLLPYECHFDRGGIDPQPIISQVEASSKKKTTKTAPVPSPGSSNSQDSFQGSVGASGTNEGFLGFGYPQDYNNQRPTCQSNQGIQQGYPGGGFVQYGDQINYGGFTGRTVYTGYPESERSYPGTGPTASQQDQYRYLAGGSGYPTSRTYPPPPSGSPVTPPHGGNSPAPSISQLPTSQQDYYRTGSDFPTQQYPSGSKTMPPPQPGPRRHPDFVKETPQPSPSQPPVNYTPYPQTSHRPPPSSNLYSGWSNSNGSQFRGSYPVGGGASGVQGWVSNSKPVAPSGAQWPPGSVYQPGWSPQQVRPPRPQHTFRPVVDSQVANSQSKQYPSITSPPNIKSSGGICGSYSGIKRELTFPDGSVEGTTPLLYKRKRLGRVDVAPVDAWRVMMALKSGLLAETTWALDVLNILLFDDNSVTYFGLLHLPGLLDILLEHMKVALQEMLEPNEEKECDTPIYLGGVLNSSDTKSRTRILHHTLDMTLRSYRGHPVTFISAHDDIFVTDSLRHWDPDNILDQGHLELDNFKYIVTTFKSEVCNIPFTRMIHCIDGRTDVPFPVFQFSSCNPFLWEESTHHSKVYKNINASLNDNTFLRIEEESYELDSDFIKRERNIKSVIEVGDENVDLLMENVVKSELKEVFDIKIKDPSGTMKRRRMSDYEEECYSKDEASLYLVTESQDWLARRCISISTILRNLTFVPGNEAEYSKSATFLTLVGRLLLLHHEHPPRQPKQRNYDRDEDADTGDSCSSLASTSQWWWDFLHHLRENALVSLANICGQVDLGLYPEDVSRPILDGLLHWAVCPAAHGQDPFPTVSITSPLSPQRLALEALCKLCVTDSNVDLVIATPPYCRLERLTSVLTKLLCRSEDQVLREFGVNLLYYLGAADSGMARTIGLQAPSVSLLVGFVEQAENAAVSIANTSGIGVLRENPEQAMGTSVDMVRRACRALLALSRHPANKPLIQQHEQRLLHLVMSHVLDQSAAQTLARVLYQVSRSNTISTCPLTQSLSLYTN